VPDEIKTPELCIAAVKQNGFALEFVPKDLMTTEVCLAAVYRYGCALEYVPESLKSAEMCLAAIRQNALALEYVPENLKTLELCLEAIREAGGGNHVPRLHLSEHDMDVLEKFPEILVFVRTRKWRDLIHSYCSWNW
jgi:hypothetical protein